MSEMTMALTASVDPQLPATAGVSVQTRCRFSSGLPEDEEQRQGGGGHGLSVLAPLLVIRHTGSQEADTDLTHAISIYSKRFRLTFRK